MITFNRTKVVATLGPGSRNKETLSQLIEAGVDVFRLNFSHGTHEEHEKTINTIHEVTEELNTHVAILADLQGPKIRLGDVEEGTFIKKDDIITLTTNEMIGNSETLYINYNMFAVDVSLHDKILIDDGKLELKITDTNGIDEVKAQVIYGGEVKSKKGVNLPETNISISSLTQKDIRDLDFILSQNINWIALSFVRTADEILRLKGMIQYKNHQAKVVAKIEKPEAIENIDEIIRVTDAIMVARGDLGVEVPLEKVPIMQKKIVKKCIAAAKPVIIATQMMESMMENPAPTRAEVTDVANAIFDGADALMLSGETAVGKYPVLVVKTFNQIIKEVEKESSSIYHRNIPPTQESSTFLSDILCYTACRMAQAVEAKAIIGMTKSGYTGFMLSSFRPKANIFVFTESAELLDALSLVWGVRAYAYHKFISTDNTIQDVQYILKQKGLIKSGDIVINTGSMPLNQRGMTNTIKLTKLK